jgi:hypothetical protein
MSRGPNAGNLLISGPIQIHLESRSQADDAGGRRDCPPARERILLTEPRPVIQFEQLCRFVPHIVAIVQRQR